MRRGKSRNRVVDLFQLAKKSLRFRQLRENGAVCFGKLVHDYAGQFDESLAVAGELVAALDFSFLSGNEICHCNFANLMTKQIKLLFARCLHRVERGVLSEQRLELSVILSVFGELLFGARKRIEQVQLLVG